MDPASDKAIEEAIRKVLKKPDGKLTDKDYEKITELNLANLGLRTLTGLSKCRKLKSLNAGYIKLRVWPAWKGAGK